MAFKKFPTGHPEIKTILDVDGKYDDEYFADIFGIVYCDVIPSQSDTIGILPSLINGRLMFPLCRTCAELTNQRGACLHDIDERKLTGVWTSFELEAATRRGYIVDRIHEQWDYKNYMVYNQKDGLDSGIFTAYMLLWQKLEVESSGFPANVNTTTEKQLYIDHIKKEYYIDINTGAISKNIGRKY